MKLTSRIEKAEKKLGVNLQHRFPDLIITVDLNPDQQQLLPEDIDDWITVQEHRANEGNSWCPSLIVARPVEEIARRRELGILQGQ